VGMLDRGGGDREASGFRIASCSTLAIVTTCATGCWTSRRLTRRSSLGLWLARSHTTKGTGGRISTSCSPSQTRCLCPKCWKPGPRPSFASSGRFSCSTSRAVRSSTGCSCSRTALSLICRSRERPTSARVVPHSGCSSGRQTKSRTSRHPPRISCLATPSITRSTHALPSSEVGIGRQSIGSARYATAHSPACGRLGLDGWYGRDFDRLPADVLVPVNDALVRSLEPDELDRALASAVAALLRESAEVGEMADKVEGQLRELASRDIS
jgi:hypothetical protein